MASRFSIPDRLYGREAETAELLASLERVADGSAELLLLVGGSGVGKSVLVQEIQGPTVERRGFFIRGKFDQYSASAPYASLIDAVRELVHQLLGEPPERIATWRDAILTALAGNAAVVGDVIPDVTLITGPLPPVAELGPTETQNRFNVVFRRFIRTFARPEHPLVIFLDDLHWADAASIRLLRTLVSDPDARHLLIIGAYRPEAVDPSGPLAAAIAALDPSSVRHIELGPLGLDTVTRTRGRYRAGGPGRGRCRWPGSCTNAPPGTRSSSTSSSAPCSRTGCSASPPTAAVGSGTWPESGNAT